MRNDKGRQHTSQEVSSSKTTNEEVVVGMEFLELADHHNGQGVPSYSQK